MSILRRRPQPQPTYAADLPEGDPQPAFERIKRANAITAHYLRGGHAAPAPTVEPTETVPVAGSADDLADALLVMRVGPEGPSLREFLAMALLSRSERAS